MNKIEWDFSPSPSIWVESFDLKPPEGGWKPVCCLEDHTWQIEFDGADGNFHLICIDAHTEEQIAEMEPNGISPSCYLSQEYLSGQTPPFKLKWVTDCPRRGYNDSGSHGSSCDCDYWV